MVQLLILVFTTDVLAVTILILDRRCVPNVLWELILLSAAALVLSVPLVSTLIKLELSNAILVGQAHFLLLVPQYAQLVQLGLFRHFQNPQIVNCVHLDIPLKKVLRIAMVVITEDTVQ